MLWISAEMPPEVPAACVISAAEHFSVPVELLVAIAKVEGGKVGVAYERSHGTYYGPYQISDKWLPTLSKWGYSANLLKDDACANVSAGAYVLAHYQAQESNWQRAIARYNVGSLNTDKRLAAGQRYLKKVLTAWSDIHEKWAKVPSSEKELEVAPSYSLKNTPIVSNKSTAKGFLANKVSYEPKQTPLIKPPSPLGVKEDSFDRAQAQAREAIQDPKVVPPKEIPLVTQAEASIDLPPLTLPPPPDTKITLSELKEAVRLKDKTPLNNNPVAPGGTRIAAPVLVSSSGKKAASAVKPVSKENKKYSTARGFLAN